MNQEQFIAELGNLCPAATFLTILSYCNEFSEVADYNIVFHISYEKAVQKSLAMMKEYRPQDDLEKVAKKQLIDSFEGSLHKIKSTPEEELQDHFLHFKNKDGIYIKGIKFHHKSNALHLYGLVNYKRIVLPGFYSKTNSQPLTVVKNKLRHMTPCGKFRTFIMTPDRVKSISVNNLSLLPPIN